MPRAEVAPIGEVRTRFSTKATTPVQSALNADEPGRVDVFDPYRDGLAELDGFDYAWLLTWLEPESSAPVALRQTPFLLGASERTIGLFAMRGPRRPNPIGLHLVRLAGVDGEGFGIHGVDMVDRTPVLDIKPWVARFDVPFGHRVEPGVRSGWFDSVDLSGPHTPDSLRRR